MSTIAKNKVITVLTCALLLLSSCSDSEDYMNSSSTPDQTNLDETADTTSDKDNQIANNQSTTEDNTYQEDIINQPSDEPEQDTNNEVPPLAPPASLNPNDIEELRFASDFETESQLCWSNRPNYGTYNFLGCGGFINIGNGSIVSLAENEISHSGNKSLKVTFNVNEDYGGAEVSFTDSERIFTRYYDYYSTNFDFPYGMKIHRIRSFNQETQVNNFDSTVLIVGRPRSGEFDYGDINDTMLLTFGANGGPTDWGSAEVPLSLNRDQWYCVESEMKLNTPGQSNGETRVWIDGRLVIERTGLNIRGSLTSKINTILFGGWYSNGAAGYNPYRDPHVTATRYLDDVAVSTHKIGCL